MNAQHRVRMDDHTPVTRLACFDVMLGSNFGDRREPLLGPYLGIPYPVRYRHRILARGSRTVHHNGRCGHFEPLGVGSGFGKFAFDGLRARTPVLEKVSIAKVGVRVVLRGIELAAL